MFPTLLFDLLPGGFRALVLTAMLAAIMSSVDSTLNAASTLVTMDFVKRKNPGISAKALVRVGRIVTFACMVFAIAWSPVIVGFDTLWSYLQSTLAYVAPPAIAVFALGVLWPRATGPAALAGLVVGHLTSALILALTLTTGFAISFLYLAPLLLIVSLAVVVGVSLATPPPPAEKLDGTVWTPALFRAETEELRGLPFWKNYRVQAAVLVVATAVLVGMFW